MTPLKEARAKKEIPPARFALTLQAVPDHGGAPVIIRLRRFLKMALRSYGLRCVKIKQEKEVKQ